MGEIIIIIMLIFLFKKIDRVFRFLVVFCSHINLEAVDCYFEMYPNWEKVEIIRKVKNHTNPPNDTESVTDQKEAVKDKISW